MDCWTLGMCVADTPEGEKPIARIAAGWRRFADNPAKDKLPAVLEDINFILKESKLPRSAGQRVRGAAQVIAHGGSQDFKTEANSFLAIAYEAWKATWREGVKT